MAPIRQRNEPLRIFVRRLGMLALAGLVVFAGSALWNVYQKELESRALRTQAEVELEHLAGREAHLRSEMERLQSERGREEVLREHFEVGREGERLVVIVDPPVAEPIQATSTVFDWFQRMFEWRPE